MAPACESNFANYSTYAAFFGHPEVQRQVAREITEELKDEMPVLSGTTPQETFNGFLATIKTKLLRISEDLQSLLRPGVMASAAPPVFAVG